jgi:hypothetical protein
MAARELIDQAYLRVANRGNQPDKDAQLAGLVLLVEALRSLPDDPPTSGERNWRGYGTQRHWSCSGTFSPERLPRAAVKSVEVV